MLSQWRDGGRRRKFNLQLSNSSSNYFIWEKNNDNEIHYFPTKVKTREEKEAKRSWEEKEGIELEEMQSVSVSKALELEQLSFLLPERRKLLISLTCDSLRTEYVSEIT